MRIISKNKIRLYVKEHVHAKLPLFEWYTIMKMTDHYNMQRCYIRQIWTHDEYSKLHNRSKLKRGEL